MSFLILSPLYLIGGLAALIPLVIHLSRSRRTKKMRFSTTRFFTDQFLRSYRMSRLREVLLLACRMLLFAIFAAALSQPLFMPKNSSLFFGGEGARAVVLVLDNSASMAYTEEYPGEDGVNRRGTLLERAQSSAVALIDSLGSGDVATVVLAGRRAGGPEVLLSELSPDLADVRQKINGVRIATRVDDREPALGTDLTGAIDKAEKLLEGSQAANKEIFVFSDLQDSGWELNRLSPNTDMPDVGYTFVRVKPIKPPVNRAIVTVQYGSPRPMVGVPFAIRPLVHITGEDDRPVEVSLFIDGEKVGQQPVQKMSTGRWAVPRFYHTFATGGWHSGYVEVEDQTLAADNRRYFALQVIDQVRVLAVNGAPSQVPRLDELFFLRFALTAAKEGSKPPVALDTVAPAGLAEVDLAKYPLVIVANVEQLTEVAVKKLEDFTSAGGSVLFFLGDKVNPAFYNQAFFGANQRNGGLLPAKLVARVGEPEGKETFTIGGINYNHSALSTFEDPKFAQLLGPSIVFKAYWKVEPDKENTAILLKTNKDDALLCEKKFGKGRVMLFASTCDRDWTNFPARPAFLPFNHLLVAYLAQDPLSSQAFHSTGSAVPLSPPGADLAGTLLVKKPNGVVASAVEASDGSGGLVFNDTIQLGVYSVLAPDQKSVAGLFALNLDNYESDLSYLDDFFLNKPELAEFTKDHERIEEGLKAEVQRKIVSYIDDPRLVGTTAGRTRGGFKMWDAFLFLVLLIGFFEPWLANRISARLYSRPRDLAAVTRAAQTLPALNRSTAAEATR